MLNRNDPRSDEPEPLRLTPFQEEWERTHPAPTIEPRELWAALFGSEDE